MIFFFSTLWFLLLLVCRYLMIYDHDEGVEPFIDNYVSDVASMREYSERTQDLTGFHVLLQNIRSTNVNFDQLAISLEINKINLEIIGLTETWYKYGDAPLLNGYNVYEQSSNLNKCSGVALYVRNDFYMNVMDYSSSFINSDKFDVLFINGAFGKLKEMHNMDIGILYRSPSTNVQDF